MRPSTTRIARVFRSGNSQAVRLPREFRFDVEEVEISREGDAVILRPRRDAPRPRAGLQSAVARGVAPDFLADGREQPEAQSRADLDRAFE